MALHQHRPAGGFPGGNLGGGQAGTPNQNPFSTPFAAAAAPAPAAPAPGTEVPNPGAMPPGQEQGFQQQLLQMFDPQQFSQRMQALQDPNTRLQIAQQLAQQFAAPPPGTGESLAGLPTGGSPEARQAPQPTQVNAQGFGGAFPGMQLGLNAQAAFAPGAAPGAGLGPQLPQGLQFDPRLLQSLGQRFNPGFGGGGSPF